MRFVGRDKDNAEIAEDAEITQRRETKSTARNGCAIERQGSCKLDVVSETKVEVLRASSSDARRMTGCLLLSKR